MPAWVLPAAIAAGNQVGNFLGGVFQSQSNEKLAKKNYKYQMKMMEYQNAYNSPANQRKLLEEGGYNPALALGGAANNSTMSSPPRYEEQPVDWQRMFANVGTELAQIQLMKSQTDLTNTKVQESTVKQDLNKAQADLVKANPLMKPEYVNAMVTQLVAAAKLKEQDASFLTGMIDHPGKPGQAINAGYYKMLKELDLLEQKFNLGSADQAIKAKVLESKEFQNALQQIQVQWMKDAQITPQHIYMGIMMIIQKMMSR